MQKVFSVSEIEEPVKRFLEGVVTAEETPAVEMNGLRVHFVVVPILGNGHLDDPWTPEKNQRRCDLIDKEIDRSITSTERVELANLKQQLRRYVNKVAPLPIDAARKLHAELLEKAAQAESGAGA